jgi:sugar phosphate isomerase/epimerase
MNRRQFLSATVPVAAAPLMSRRLRAADAQRGGVLAPRKARFRTGLVAYSFQRQLQAKTMTYEDLIRIAVETGTDGVDMTVYWLPSTTPDYLVPLRRLAYRNRVEIYSIGTRVQLGHPPGPVRDKHLADLRGWIDVAGHLGASHIRVFGGPRPTDATLDQAVAWAGETLRLGAELSGARGITLGVEDDGGITDFARETVAIVTGANSPWAGMTLDTGNFRPPKVYEQIELSIPHAVNTHIKTTFALDDGSGRAPADLDRVFGMFAAHGFRGYMGLEYEATEEDPAVAVPKYLRQLKELAVKYSA